MYTWMEFVAAEAAPGQADVTVIACPRGTVDRLSFAIRLHDWLGYPEEPESYRRQNGAARQNITVLPAETSLVARVRARRTSLLPSSTRARSSGRVTDPMGPNGQTPPPEACMAFLRPVGTTRAAVASGKRKRRTPYEIRR
jgi:hypothetical protein